jgi:sarcosine oxidase
VERRTFLKASAGSPLWWGGYRRPVTTSPEVIVIGAGAFGSWTAWYLQQMGARVTLVEAYGPGNSRSSSGGETRLIRADYGEEELYTKLVLKALPLWKRWEAEWRTELLLPSGRLLMARPEGMEDLRLRQKRLAGHGFPTEILTHDELRHRWPQINLEDIAGGIHDTISCIVKARQSCQVVVEQFRRVGGRVVIGTARPGETSGGRLTGLTIDGRNQLHAASYVFACGPWLRKIFPLLLGPRLRTPRRDVFFFGLPAGDDRFHWRRMPSWGFGGPSGDPGFSNWYGFPDVDERGLKACPVDDATQIDPDSDERLVNAWQLKRARDYVTWRFPALRNQPIIETRVCQTENSVDNNFIVTPHPEMENVWIAGGGSGHGFKHGPAVGEYLASRILGRHRDPELDRAFTLKERTF